MTFGSTGYAFFMDSYDLATNAAGAMVELDQDQISKFSGINPEAITAPSSGLSDSFTAEAPTGVTKFAPIVLEGQAQRNAAGIIDPASDFAVIGGRAHRDDYPSRTFRAVHRAGVEQEIEVFPKMREILTTHADLIRWRITLAVSARVAADYVETGL